MTNIFLDLAARNILMTEGKNSRLIAKVAGKHDYISHPQLADFGLSRLVVNTDTENKTGSTTGPLVW